MEVQGCRLPGFKTCQNSPNASLQLPGATQAAVNLSCSSNKSLRPWQCPFKRFPAAPRRHSGCGEPFLQLQQVPEAVAMSFYGGSRLPFARLQNSPKLPKRFPAAPRRHSGRGEPFLQLQQVPEAVAMSFYGGSRLPFARLQNSPKLPKRFPAAPRRHSGRGEPFLQLQQVPEAVAMSFYGGSRLPFASLQNSPKLSKRFPAAPRRHSGRGEPFLQLQQVSKPWQCPFMEVQGCRLPAFKTRQNSPNASLQLPGATQAAVNLSCSSNKSRSRGNVLFWRFKAAVCQASKLAKTPQTLPCSSQAPLRPR